MDAKALTSYFFRAIRNVVSDGWLSVTAVFAMAVALMTFGLYWLVFINVDPLFSGFRTAPELASLVARIGLDAEPDVADSTWMSETEIFPD